LLFWFEPILLSELVYKSW